MSELGQFLEVVCGPDERYISIRATIRQWTDPKLAATAEGPNRSVFGRRKAPEPVEPSIDEEKLKVWILSPDCLRIESTRGAEDDADATLLVVAGEKWWSRDDEGHVETHEGSKRGNPPATTDVERHFDGAMLRNFLGGLSLEQTGLVSAAGCTCVRIRAINRPTGQIWSHWLPSDAEEYEFHAELRRGVLLGILALSKGQPYWASVVQSIAFDEPLDEELFVYRPEPGEQVQPSVPVVEHLSLDAAIQRMPFAVLVPQPLPDADSTHLELMYHPSRKQSPCAHLTLSLRGSDVVDNTWIDERQSPDPDRDHYEWEHIVHRNTDLYLSDPDVEDGYRLLSFEREGTHVKIVSKLSPQELFDLAASMTVAERGM